ncbi:MAG: hypothetical protein KFH87_14910 [Bacteroidetes bacterium]|nr:hypothetical protein [Bacteroidota bacterium]
MYRFHWYLLLAALCTATAEAQQFQMFLDRALAAPEHRRQFMADSVLSVIDAFPYRENDTTAWFLYKGTAGEVALTGDMNAWSDSRSPLRRLDATDLWYRMEHFEADARLDYKFIIDKDWLLDPRNPFTISSAGGPSSELRMPGYTPPPEIYSQDGVPHGTLIDTTFASQSLSNNRLVRIYLPAGYTTGQQRYPVLLFHDGNEYLTHAAIMHVLNNLIAKQQIPPCIAVFVSAADRHREYAGDLVEAYTDFIVHTIMPAIDAQFHTSTDPGKRITFGTANGGNISLYIAMKHPEVFGCVAAQSSNIVGNVHAAYQHAPHLPLRLYLDVGTYDIPMLIPIVHDFVALLAVRGYEHHFQEPHEGHSWGNWRGHLRDALEYHLARLLDITASTETAARKLSVGAIWPNPASARITVPVTLPYAGRLRISLHDMLGREVQLLHDALAPPGSTQQHVPLPAALPPGRYFMHTRFNGMQQVQTLLVR